MNQAKTRTSGFKVKVEDLDDISKNIKKKLLSTGEKRYRKCGTHLLKRQNLIIIGIDEGKESQVNGIDQIFGKSIEKIFPKLMKGITQTDI